ncbi:MAG TPA: hypothetical protein VLG50_03470 [Candidatus Saccharimonadales bacterium]|nr:hypothetical protein [Candidatus Saccharimonadales bacterium]
MRKNLKYGLQVYVAIISMVGIITCAAFDDDAPMRATQCKPREVMNAQDEFNKILGDPVFLELQKMHQNFKLAKEDLGRRKDAKEISDVEFTKQFEDLRNAFNKRQQDFKAQHKNRTLYSLLESQKLLEQFKELQKQEESALKQQHLLTKETYDRKRFEKERNKIERIHEAVRTFIRLFSQEPQTATEKVVMSDLQKAQQEYKDSWYNLKSFYLPQGQETFEKEKEFQAAEQVLLQEFNAKILVIRQRLHQEIDAMLRADAIAAAAQATAEVALESLTNTAMVTQSQTQAAAFPKMRPSKL